MHKGKYIFFHNKVGHQKSKNEGGNFDFGNETIVAISYFTINDKIFWSPKIAF